MSNIWAIAKNTMAQAIRMKVALIVILLLGILIPILSVIVTGDGTLTGKLQTFSSYGISLMSMMLCFLAISISCYTLNFDIKNKQIFTVITKPVRRYEILLGKFIGLFVLNASLLIMFSIVIYTLTMYLPKFTKTTSDEVKQADNEFYTSRIGLKPTIDYDQIEIEAEKEFEKMKKAQDPFLEGKTNREVITMLKNQRLLNTKSVGPGGVLSWKFYNVRPETQDETIFLRFKYEVSADPPDLNIYSRWVAGDLRAIEKGEKPKTNIYDSYLRKDVVRTAREIEIPASVVAEDGYLEVAFQNIYYNGTTVIPKEVEVLYKSDSFTVNYIRAVLLVLLRIVFLTALGVAVSTWLSFPVAIFICVVFYLTGTVNGFIMESIESLSMGVGIFYSFTVKPLLSILPRFDGDFNPAPMIVSGRTITWTFLLGAWFWTVVVKAALIFLFGMLVFSKREIAKVTV